MDPMIWSRFPFQIMEMIFLCLPLSTLICFRIVCKEWNVFLQNLQFLSQCNRFSIKEFGFLVPFLNTEERSFIGTYIHQKGHTSHLLLPFIERTCKVQCIVWSMILLSAPTRCSHTNNYYVLNPFTKEFKHLGSLWVGDCGFFSLLQNVCAKKYDSVALKHVYTGMQSHYFICSSIFKCWRRTTIPFGGTTPPKEVIFYKSKMFWFI